MKKKLIEVAIPLEAINTAAAREKSIRHGHPSTLHLWWARRPLAACRAILFAQLVDDPSSHPELFPDHEAQERERKRLYAIIEKLVEWENSTNEEVLDAARSEIRKSCGGDMPSVFDPFSGGGSIPLEAQRLGLPANGADLNPVAVMIGKAMIELPHRFQSRPPIHPNGKSQQFYRHAEGLAEDVQYYGEVMRTRAFERIGQLYPEVDVPNDLGGGSATVVAWIWARTVPSPDPAFANVPVPIASSFLLSAKAGKEAWLVPVVDKAQRQVTFTVHTGSAPDAIERAKNGTKVGRANFRCLLSDAAIDAAYVRRCAKQGLMGSQLIGIVAEGRRGRLYLPADKKQLDAALAANPAWKPEGLVPAPSHDVDRLPMYGMPTWGDAFSNRQLVALNTLSELVHELRSQIEADAINSGMNDDGIPLREGGTHALAYAEAVSVYLAFLVGQMANHSSTVCGWNSPNQQMRSTFSRQAIPMTWDYAEVNVFSSSSGSYKSLFDRMVKGFETLGFGSKDSRIIQSDAQQLDYGGSHVISTDPPYYDNISYSDVSDFFYSWMKPALKSVYPDLFSLMATPKSDELIASPDRHGGKESAEAYFLSGMSVAMANMAKHANADFPVTIYYAFKQSDIEAEGVSSTGWATFIEAVLRSGFSVVGTWPVRTEKPGRLIAVGTNALANSVVLVCRKKPNTAETITRAEFVRALKRELPPAIGELQAANIAPADMPQSAIGPGMGVFSRYKAVLESDDSPMAVKTALQLINRELDEYLGGIQGEFDADTRFAISWFEQNGMGKGDYGVADNLARARGISVESVKHAGIVESAAGKVRILSRDDLDAAWTPESDTHLTVWECLQHLVKIHEKDGLSHETALLMKKIGTQAEAVKDLAYCLYDISANKRKDAKEATAYNALIADWTELTRQAAAIHDTGGNRQIRMDI